MKVGERVIVECCRHWDGIHHHGFIEDIYDFARASFFEVHFDKPTPWGVWGTTVTNPGLIRKEDES